MPRPPAPKEDIPNFEMGLRRRLAEKQSATPVHNQPIAPLPLGAWFESEQEAFEKLSLESYIITENLET